jgi:galactokinase
VEVSANQQAADLLQSAFGPGPAARIIAAPGRVNLIGEHIDYHLQAVLPMALERRITIAFRPRPDSTIRAISAGQPRREFVWAKGLEQAPAGDWANYIRAAAETVSLRWGTGRGIDAAVVSDLPPAAGLSSSSALLIAFTLALLDSNGIEAGFEDLMDVLPDGEQFVGTRGGGMDHAASLGSRSGHASLISFTPPAVEPVPVPAGWSFLVAHSLTHAEKSSAVMEQYNSRRRAGAEALATLGFANFTDVLKAADFASVEQMAASLPEGLVRGAFLHVAGESLRVLDAAAALKEADAERFALRLNQAHASARDQLRISHPEVDRLVVAALESGAPAARLTGAGFGGCAVVFAPQDRIEAIRLGLIERFYSGRAEFDPAQHLFEAPPGAGAIQLRTAG